MADLLLLVQSLSRLEMPIPSLPIEIVIKIASHLYDPLSSVNLSAVEDGKAVSLVCRSWYPIGQVLRWRHLLIDITSVSSLLAHFDLHPHLPQLVMIFRQSLTTGMVSEPNLTEEGFNKLPTLLKTLRQLRILKLTPIRPSFESLFQAAADLPYLHMVKTEGGHALAWNNYVDSIFAHGFPSLRTFCLHATNALSVDTRSAVAPAAHCLKPVEHLSLRSTSSNPSSLIETILASLDPTTLVVCFFLSASLDTLPCEWLATCSNLTSLSISGSHLFLTSTFPTLLSSLSKSESLLILMIDAIGNTVSYPSLVPLDSIFALLPTNLHFLSASKLKFADSHEYQDKPLSARNNDISSCTVQALTVTSEGDRCVEFWKEREAEENKGYRCILDHSSWTDYNKRYVYLHSPYYCGRLLPLSPLFRTTESA